MKEVQVKFHQNWAKVVVIRENCVVEGGDNAVFDVEKFVNCVTLLPRRNYRPSPRCFQIVYG